MKYILMIVLITSVGCSTVKSFRGPSGETIHEANCNGGMRTMANCYERASEKCPVGYTVLNTSNEQNLMSYNGQLLPVVKRNLMFTCKN